MADENISTSWPACLRTERTWAHLLLLIAQVCFSGWHIVGSVVMKKGVEPFVFVLYREMVAASIMYCILRFVAKERIHIEREDYKRFLFLGFCSFVNVVGAMLALKYISATRFAIFQPSIPCIATCISIIMGLEGFSVLKIAGIALAVGGAVLAETWKTSSSSSEDDEKNVPLGTVIVSLQVFAMANLIVFAKPILHKYPPALITLVYYSIGMVFTILIFLAFSFQYTAGDIIFNGEMLPWLGLFYVAIFATVFPYNAFSWAGKRLSPSATTVYSTFQPIGTILLSFVLLGEVVTLPEGVGTVLVILGLVVNLFAQRSEGHERVREEKHSGEFEQLLPK